MLWIAGAASTPVFAPALPAGVDSGGGKKRARMFAGSSAAVKQGAA